MKAKTLQDFSKFFEAYTKKQFSKYDEKEAFTALCKSMREEVAIKEKNNKKSAAFIAKKRLTNKNYARKKEEENEKKDVSCY